MPSPPFQREFLYPKYWPTWLGIGILRLFAFLPVSWSARFGEGLGWLLGQVLRSRRHVVRVNLRLCFPDMDDAARERVVNAHFRALGAAVFELTFAVWASDRRFRPHIEVIGIENLRAATADGSGALLLTGHFTVQEICGRVLHEGGVNYHGMYRPINNRVIDYFMHKWRSQHTGADALPRDELRTIVRALREGGLVWYAPDQTLGEKISVMAPFFGVPVRTVGATSKLARLGRARVIPYFPARVNGRYRVTVLPALENFPSGDELADTARINRVIEEGVRANLAQYFWVHKRFKPVRAGQPSVYAGDLPA